MSSISRRQFAGGCVAAVVSRALAAQPSGAKRSLREVRKYTGGALLLAVSPDGTKLCLAFSPGGPTSRVEVIEFATWPVLYSSEFTSDFGPTASFFASGKALYVDLYTTGYFIDLRSGERSERPQGGEYRGSYTALADGLLLRTGGDGSWALASLGTYGELLSIHAPKNSALTISADRRRGLWVHGTEEHWLDCYSIHDLTLIWSRRVDIPGARWDLLHNTKGAIFPALSADGRFVAVAGVDIYQWGQRKQFFVAILNGETGAETNRLNIDAAEGLAISPDGKLLAVCKRQRTGHGVDLALELYDSSSGESLAATLHRHVIPSHWEPGIFDPGRGVTFTSDGAHLVTSGANTVKVWQVG